MKKLSTSVVGKTKNFHHQKLTIGLDLWDRWSWYCVLDEADEAAGTEGEYHCESDERGVRRDAAEPDRAGNGAAFALGEPLPHTRQGARKASPDIHAAAGQACPGYIALVFSTKGGDR